MIPYAWISYGKFGHVADPINMNLFVGRVKALGVNINRSPYQWSDTQQIVEEINLIAQVGNAKIIVGGASLGDNEAVEIANMLDRLPKHIFVDLLFGFQRSKFGVQYEVPDNVSRAIEIHCPDILLDPFGDDPWILAPGNIRTQLKNIPILVPHPGDFSQGSDIVVAAIKQVI